MRKKDPHSVAKPQIVDKRLQIALMLCVGVFSVLVFRLWTIQIYQQEKYDLLALQNINREVPVLSERGKILDRYGRIIVEDVKYRDVWVPIHTAGRRRVVSEGIRTSLTLLSRILAIPYETLEHRYLINPKDTVYKQLRVRVAQKIRNSRYVAIEERRMEFPQDAMVFTEEVPTRRYYHGSSAAHILGYTGEIDANELARLSGYVMGDRIGKAGLERQYEGILRGKDGRNRVTVDKHEIQQGPAVQVDPALPGNDLVLNLDIELQKAVEQILGVSNGVIIVNDAKTNEVMAMASMPRYEPEHYADYMNDPRRPLFHKAIQGTYPPGSVFKIFEMLPILERMGVDPTYTEYCPGRFSLPGNTWHCHKREGHGHVNLYEAIAMSCNVYFYAMANRSREEPLFVMAAQMGFHTKTGIDLPEEQIAPLSRDRFRQWRHGDTINMSIGQGYARLTPLQVATAVTALANRGTVYTPRLARRAINADGVTIQEFTPDVSGVIEASTRSWDIMHQAMHDVVHTPRGTGRRINTDLPVELGGKSGTAQTSDPQDRTHAWFVCFAPHDDPEIVVTVLAELAGHGGTEAAPLARQVIDSYFGDSEIALVPMRMEETGG